MHAQLRSLARLGLDLAAHEVEIVVSDNNEDDRTLQVCKSFEDLLPLVVVRPPTPLETAEENLFFGWGHASGEYVWSLGDDDIADRDSVLDLLVLVRQGALDAMLWNARYVDTYGLPARQTSLLCFHDITELPIQDLMLRVGFWWEPSRISSWVVRRNLIDASVGRLWVRSFRSPIYSHVTFFARVLFGRRFAYINRPLITYRFVARPETRGKGTYWDNVHERLGLPRRYMWTAGFLEQWRLLVDDGVFCKADLANVLELTESSKVPLYQLIAMQLLDQIRCNLTNQGPALESDDFDAVLESLWDAAPEEFELWTAMQQLYSTSTRPGRVRRWKAQGELDAWTRRLLHRNATMPFLRYFRGSVSGWALYETSMGCCAVPLDRYHLLPAVLGGLSLPHHDDILVAPSIGELRSLAALRPSKDLATLRPLIISPSESSGGFVRSIKRLLPTRLKNWIKSILGVA